MVIVTFSFKYWKFFTHSISVPLKVRDLDKLSTEFILLRLREALKVFGVTMTLDTDTARR